MKKIFLFLFPLIALASCSDFLDRQPLTELTPDNFWKTEQDLASSLVYSYVNMTETYSRDKRTPDAYGGGPDEISNGTYTPTNTDGVWKNCYDQIALLNDFYENYSRVDEPQSVKDKYLAEARFFEAYYYFMLIKKFGDVPYVTKKLTLDSPELYMPRTDKKIILDEMLEHLKWAEQNIPGKKALGGECLRVTKGAVQALMSRMALYYGTWYKYHDPSVDYKPYLELAAEVSKRLIDSKEYQLCKDYRQLFLEEGENSVEHILARSYSLENGSANLRAKGIFAKFHFSPTRAIADAFLCKDGLPLDKSSYPVEYLPLGSEFKNRDPRMKYTIYEPMTDFRGKPFVPSLKTMTFTGYVYKKYGNTDLQDYGYIDEIIFRYAEVLLNYAEAVYELNGTITDEELDMTVNLLRRRFEGDPDQLPDLTNGFVTANGLDMKEEIRRERRVELASEGFRYDDLIRWKTAETELPVDIIGFKYDKNVYGAPKKIKLTKDGFLLVESAAKRKFDPEKNYLYPLPLREISLNDKLTQNPNW